MDLFIYLSIYVFGSIITFILSKKCKAPINILMKIAFSILVGALIITIINLGGGQYDLHIGLNLFTSFFVGISGLPGILFLITFMKYVLV